MQLRVISMVFRVSESFGLYLREQEEDEERAENDQPKDDPSCPRVPRAVVTATVCVVPARAASRHVVSLVLRDMQVALKKWSV